MTLANLIDKYGFKVLTNSNEYLSRTVTGAYACDLLSHAMAKLNMGDAWVTVHTNLNVVAVASLAEAACVIIPEDIEVEQQTISRAEEKGVVILSGSASSAEICYEILSELRKTL